MKLTPNDPTPTKQEVKVKQKQEFKLIGQLKYRPGLTLYGLNTDTLEIYEVELQQEKVIDFNRKRKIA